MRRVLTVMLWLLMASPAFSTTYYVATTGSDSNNGLSTGAPFLTITKCVTTMTGGDTCNVRQGTYNESLFIQIPSGISNTARTIVQGYSGDPTPTMHGSLTLAAENNITWDGINIDDSGDSNPTTDCILINSGSNITISHADLRNCQRHGVDTGDGNNAPLSNLLFSNLVIHNIGQGYLTSGDPRHHGMYIAASHFTTGPIVLDHIESYNTGNPANAAAGAQNSWGIQIYAAVPGFLQGVVLSNSYIHDNNQGVVMGSGSGHKAFNNIVEHNNILPNTYCEGAITISYGILDNMQVYNNTIVGNACAPAIELGQYAQSMNTVIQNNIFYQNGTDGITVGPAGATGTVDTNNLASNPLFVNAAGHDYHLSSGSPACGGGLNLYSIFTTDKDGNTRSSTAAWDQGPYTCTVTPPSPPAAPVNFHIVP